MVRLGIDKLISDGWAKLKGKRVAVLCNQASVDSNWKHILEHLSELHDSGFLQVKAVFGPQHGLRGHTQDNMIEWEGAPDEKHPWLIASLYGAARRPKEEWLAGVDLLLVDLLDIGSRYYTFLWTVDHCMEVCAKLDVPMLVLDRPNPIGGVLREGPYADSAFRSFVGWHPILVRHGLTMGELALWLNKCHHPKARVDIELCEGWSRPMYWSDTGLPWVPPSPNMPTPSTAIVYPGMCLLEGTMLSEGRGTTRPFEIAGHPGLDSDRFAGALNGENLPGIRFLPYDFQPTFQKHSGQVCGGVFLVVTDRETFRPVLTAAVLLTEAKMQLGGAFEWKLPPYEYEYEKLPIDILSGSTELRTGVEEGWTKSKWEHFTEPRADESGSDLLRKYHEGEKA